MNNAMKGAYLSGLVYPGLGQIVQRHYFRGIALIVVVTASLSLTIISTTKHVQAVLDAALASDAGGADVTALFSEALRSSASGALGISSLVITGCWVVGVVDAYLCGKSLDATRKELQCFSSSP